MQVLMNEQKLIGDNFIIDAITPKLTFMKNKVGEVININFVTNLVNETFLFFFKFNFRSNN